MKFKKLLISLTILLASLLVVMSVNAAELVAHQQGGVLPNAPDYKWWYGCSPTSAGMMMGYYDINGYGGLAYDNLVPGGTAETLLFGAPGLGNNAIASTDHIKDYYPNGYLGSGDDIAPAHTNDSIADFMGTSQDSVGNVNGSTTFWNYTDGSRLYGNDVSTVVPGGVDYSGMYGMWEYFTYAGYTVSPDNFFNQYIDTLGFASGFSFADYQAEIDAGRVVMIHVRGHSMFGYGYDGNDVILHDTWSAGPHTMAWGGTYPYIGTESLLFYGVTCFTPDGGSSAVPEPTTIALFGFGLLGFALVARRKRTS